MVQIDGPGKKRTETTACDAETLLHLSHRGECVSVQRRFWLRCVLCVSGGETRTLIRVLSIVKTPFSRVLSLV